tara:strand:+ start:3234 stop:4274 length:1041 start_codon:yes stop_codon:yes gene_type:complete
MTVKIAKPKIETRQKFEELRKPSGIAGESMLRAKTTGEQQALLGVGRKNLLINSAFQISQRGDYTSATAMTTNNYKFGVDRWQNNTSNVAATFQQLTGYPTANENYMRLVATSSASGYYRMFQRIEGNFEGRVLTFSAWVKSNDSDARLITIATGAWVTNNKAKHSGSGLWEKLTLTVTAGDYDNPHFVIGNMNSAHGNTDVTAGDYIEVANPQVEIGTVPTPLEYRTQAEELALCQRYFHTYGGNSTNERIVLAFAHAANQARGIIQNPVTMRTTPTIIVSAVNHFIIEHSGTNAVCTAIAVDQPSPQNTAINFTVGSNALTQGHGMQIMGNSTTSARLQISAEV